MKTLGVFFKNIKSGDIISSSPPVANIQILNAWKKITSSGTSNTTVNPTSGNFLFVAVNQIGASDSNSTCADNIDGTTGWVKIGSVTNTNGIPLGIVLFYKKNIPSGVTTITFTPTTGAGYTGVFVHEISGLSASQPYETGEVVFDMDSIGATNAQTSSLTNSFADSIFFAIVADSTGANPATFTLNQTGTTGGTWALKSSTNSQETNGSANWAANVAYLIVSSSASTKHGWTIDGGQNVSKAIVCFHA